MLEMLQMTGIAMVGIFTNDRNFIKLKSKIFLFDDLNQGLTEFIVPFDF